MRLYMKYFEIHLKSIMQYKGSFFATLIGSFLTSFTVFLGIFFMFRRFHTVAGFSYEEVMLCYGIMLMGFAVAQMFASGFKVFDSMIANGEFDRILCRPRNEIFQVLAFRIDFVRLGMLLQGIVMLAYGLASCQVDWNVPRVITVVFMITGGMVLFSALFLLDGSIAFFTLQGLEFMNVFTYGAIEHGKYPIAIYGKGMLTFCTFLIPYALVQYYPLTYVLGRSGNPLFIFLPLVACLFVVPCWGVWRMGVRRYKSTGS
ncbi:ABC transporter permease [Acutalibacter caecimuris]|uniref:ABC transporter permease n=1 Tax=Acutalibacter caecimuris TaxID=3093657 RepID=UPI002AC97CC3|nr:ABC-2 family transporter protein [Acutalibacter sp. M00118]